MAGGMLWLNFPTGENAHAVAHCRSKSMINPRMLGLLSLLFFGAHACAPTEPVQPVQEVPPPKTYESMIRFGDGTTAMLQVKPDGKRHYQGMLDFHDNFELPFTGVTSEGTLLLFGERCFSSPLIFKFPNFPTSLGGSAVLEGVTETFTTESSDSISFQPHPADGEWPFDFTYSTSVSEIIRVQVVVPFRIRGRLLFGFFDLSRQIWSIKTASFQQKSIRIEPSPCYIAYALDTDRSFYSDLLVWQGHFDEAYTSATFQIGNAVTVVVEKKPR